MPLLKKDSTPPKELVEIIASIIKEYGTEGVSCRSMYYGMDVLWSKDEYMPVLMFLVMSKIIRHDESTKPCRMIFVGLPDERGNSQGLTQ